MAEVVQTEQRTRSPLFWLILIIAVILTGWALKATASVVLPIVFAFFVAIAVGPLDRRIRAVMPKGLRWVGHLVSLLLLLAILGTFFAGIGLAARQVLAKFPPQIAEVQKVMDGSAEAQAELPQQEQAAETPLARAVQPQAPAQEPHRQGAQGGLLDRLGAYKDELGQMMRERGTQFASAILSGTVGFFSALVLVLFLALFMLIETPEWRQKFATVLTRREKANWVNAIEDTSSSLRWFLLVKGALGLVTAGLYAGWLMIMGLDLIMVWFVVTFLLNFIPVLGSIIGGALAAGYAFFQLDFSTAVIVALGLLAIEQVMGNYVEPKFLGRQLAISPLVVLVSLVLWGWLWGTAGALLATPILIFVLYIAAHHPPLRPLAVLLAEKGEESLEAIDSRQR